MIRDGLRAYVNLKGTSTRPLIILNSVHKAISTPCDSRVGILMNFNVKIMRGRFIYETSFIDSFREIFFLHLSILHTSLNAYFDHAPRVCELERFY